MKIILFSFIITFIIKSLIGKPQNYTLYQFCNNFTNYEETDENICSCNYDGYCLNENLNKKDNICGCSFIDLESGYSITINNIEMNYSNFVCHYSFTKSYINNDIMKIKILNEKTFPKFDYFLIFYNNNYNIKNETSCLFNSGKFDSNKYIEIIESNCHKMSIYLYFENSLYSKNFSLIFNIE